MERGQVHMAIYHLSAKVISRGKGQSAVASASYRSGEKLQDERTGETKFYKREVQPQTMILAPSHSPEWVQDREKLWNEVEKSEKRVNSQLAREMEISLPAELSHEQQKELIKNYVQEQFVNKGMVADISIHRDDESNPHAHIMLTTREISEDGFTNKNRDWNDRKQLENWREQWSLYANKAMEREGINERIDHRSHAKRGLETLPTQHLGHVAHAMEKKGERTERGDYNREVEAYNKNVVDLAKYREEKRQLQEQVKTKKFLKGNELANIQKATKVINDKGKGFVSLDSISKRYKELDNKTKRLDWQGENSNKQLSQFKKAESYLIKVKDMERKLSLQEQRLKDHSGVFKSLSSKNRIIKEKAKEDIAFLKGNINKFDKYLDHYRSKLGFQTRDEFYRKQSHFLKERETEKYKRINVRTEIKQQKEILKVAEKDLQRKEVREITSQYPELNHLSETMKYKDALNLKEVNQTYGQTVPFRNIEKALEIRTNKINEATKELKQLEKAERTINQAENYLSKLDEVQSKIDKVERNPFLKGKMAFSKTEQQAHERNILQREHLQKSLDKIGIPSEEKLKDYKEKIDKIIKENRPQLKKEIQRAKEGESGVSLEQLQKAVNSVEQAEKDHQKGRKEYENKKTKEPEIEIGG